MRLSAGFCRTRGLFDRTIIGARGPLSQRSVAAADLQARGSAVVRDLQPELDRPAADRAILDITRRSGAEVDQGLEGLAAVGALHGPQLQARGAVIRIVVVRLDHRLEAVELVQIRRIVLASRHLLTRRAERRC